MQRAWLRRGVPARLLWPVSLLYGALAAARRAAYRAGLLRVTSLPVPVIVVGNVVAGGAGKTPVVTALLEHLAARGIEAGVVSRGYGRQTTDCRAVEPDSLPADVGDEPLLIARTGAPVFVARRRVDAARALLLAHPRTQVIVSDDGLQHLALARDIEICVFDARGTGNGWLLPAGPLREKWPRPADLVLQAGDGPGAGGWAMRRTLASFAVSADGTRIEWAELRQRHLTAVAGIANPRAFFDMLRENGLQPDRTIALADHHDYAAPPVPGDEAIVCTEKDAVKLWRLRPDAWAVPLRVEIPRGFWDALDRLLDAKLSSPHGSQTDRVAGVPRHEGSPRP
nr:tetraacyldisaccharide 4'-kinase [Caenimonas aquaedulcis]